MKIPSREPEAVKFEVACPECGYDTILWSEPSDKPCPNCHDDRSPADLTTVSGVGASVALTLWEAGFKSIRDLQEASQSELTQNGKIANGLAARIKADVGGPPEEGSHDLTQPVDGYDVLNDMGYDVYSQTLIAYRVHYSDGSVVDGETPELDDSDFVDVD